MNKSINPVTLLDSYLDKTDWRVSENSNAPSSVGAMTKYAAGDVYKYYWLDGVYSTEIKEAHESGYMHIHDLSAGLTLYCCGYSLKELLRKGIKGVPNIPRSTPAKHLDAALSHLVNATSIFQNEIAGAVAFSSLDTLMAPFIKKDKLSYKEVYQKVQNFIYAINSNSRAGAEPAFSNVTLDLRIPKDLYDEPAEIAGVEQDFTYGDCQDAANLFNEVFLDIMIDGDSDGRPFSYPIPTYSIVKDFDWESPLAHKLFKLAGKYGNPYFANYINSDMSPEDTRSMCCRLRLDLRELRRKNGGLFGSGDSTGSIGVVTLDLPKYAYEAKHNLYGSKETDELARFYEILDKYMDLAKNSLEIKRKFLNEEILPRNLLPAFNEYVGTTENHFSTIGMIGLNEVCMNLIGESILSDTGRLLSLDILDHMRDKLSDYQEETGHLYNLEATPAESTSFRLALIDKSQYPDIYTQGPVDAPYYTNSCHIPVRSSLSMKELFDHQDDLQCKFTGGTVVHLYCGGPLQPNQAKHIIKTICSNYSLPYISISPVVTLCPDHGQIDHKVDKCPFCGKDTKQLQRITGYIRDTRFWNPGKKSEYSDRTQFTYFSI